MSKTRAPALLGVSHGTSNSLGQRAVQSLGAAVASAAADRGLSTHARLGHVDVQAPDVKTLLGALDDGQPAVIVPLLLSAGYHVRVDLQQEIVEDFDAGRSVSISGALGPDERLTDLLARRLDHAGVDTRHDVVLLGAAGSSDRGAQADCREAAARLSTRLGTAVTAAFLSFAEPTVTEAIAAARDQHPGSRVVIASYLLAPGYFHTKLGRSGADVVTAPLCDSAETEAPAELVEIALDRFQECLAPNARQACQSDGPDVGNPAPGAPAFCADSVA